MTSDQEHIDDKLYREHEDTLADEWSQLINNLSGAIEITPFQLERMFFMYLNKLSPNRSTKWKKENRIIKELWTSIS